jgi:cytochrome c oxidase subunit I
MTESARACCTLADMAMDYSDAFAGWNMVSSIGAYVFFAGLVIFMLGVVYAFVRKEKAAANRWG